MKIFAPLPAFKMEHRVLRKYPYSKLEIAVKLFWFIVVFTLPRPYHYYIRFYKWADMYNKKLKFIVWFYQLFPGKYCWTDAVSWAHSPTRFNPFSIDTSAPCETESKTHPNRSCYCGNWNEGVCWDKLSKSEQKAIADEYSKDIDNNDLPF